MVKEVVPVLLGTGTDQEYPLNLEAAAARSVARSGVFQGWWSQVVSGVVTLGCLSPRPRLCAPVRACSPVCAPVCACVCACRRVQACVRSCRRCVLLAGGVGVVVYLFFVILCSRCCGVLLAV